MSAATGQVSRHDRDGVAFLTFDRPASHNAMTWEMYTQLEGHCRELAGDTGVRVVSFRGAGGKAFISGTAIEQFLHFRTADDGLQYEKRIDAVVGLVESLPQATVAVVEGWCMGGGLAIAAACDFRLGNPTAKFGVPIARTVGNCLSMANTARVVATLGVPLAKRLLLGAEILDAEQALAAGFISAICTPQELEPALHELCTRLCGHAPLTMQVAKEAIRRITAKSLGEDEDLIKLCYASADFREGVHAFVEKRKPHWQGR